MCDLPRQLGKESENKERPADEDSHEAEAWRTEKTMKIKGWSIVVAGVMIAMGLTLDHIMGVKYHFPLYLIMGCLLAFLEGRENEFNARLSQ